MTPSQADAHDPFRAPTPTTVVADARARERVVVEGWVTGLSVAQWVGGPTLEVALDDGSAVITLALLGRRSVAGVGLGTPLVAAGTVGVRHGALLLLNPELWLGVAPDASDGEPTDFSPPKELVRQ